MCIRDSLSGALGTDPYTVQSGALGTDPYTVANGTLGSNPFTIKGGTEQEDPWEWRASDNPTRDENGNAILKFRSVGHGLEAGDSVTISGTTTSFGADLNGTYTVHSVGTSDTIFINVGVNLGAPPASLESAGGSSGVLSTNRITVAHTGHPFSNCLL